LIKSWFQKPAFFIYRNLKTRPISALWTRQNRNQAYLFFTVNFIQTQKSITENLFILFCINSKTIYLCGINQTKKLSAE
jgi:hypothetical protein